MARGKTWRVLRFDCRREDEPTITLDLTCPGCGDVAQLEIHEPGGEIVATIGLDLVFDDPSFVPPQPFMPEEIQCRHCHRIFSGEES